MGSTSVTPSDTASARTPAGAATVSVSPHDLAARIAAGEPCDLLDVRTPPEFAAGHAAGARSIPLDGLTVENARLGRSLPAEAPVYLLCQSGGRARQAQARLAEGVTAIVVEGGTDAWIAAGLPAVRGRSRGLPLQRQALLGAGILNGAGVVLTLTVHWYFIAIPAFVSCGLTLAGTADICLMGIFLSKMPWNRARRGAGACPG